ncbi:GntR family transcriptional repressor for pyruvate dehydrogenase complex [Salsuginibacillus halophilus]|uniref:GntR family transcriptional repressor for pyruvate dehydrogenase complex n=1 Tax=Salsuginibacillus halophilus TaxID=517424 RepID=A0A2P8HQF9_9BACI|nr:FadR/GntR family transcriptional regulator [Salsuginibacillus halophilus]PSL48453.1 GntR family transcriptional repressor for pyruvate dehydrogenase complex [Salsuginibacillus halophilus]
MIERRKVSHQVLDEIKKRIKSGEFPVNEKLPSETELAEIFGVSRSPVREALSVLAATGVVESKQGGGSWVRPLQITDFLEKTTLEVMTPAEMIQLLETRMILETEAAALAAERATEAERKAMAEAQKDLEKLIDDDEQIGDEADFAFHQAVMKGAKNPILLSTFTNISDLYNKAMKISLEINRMIRGKKQQVYDEHNKVYEAIVAGDPEAAREAMHIHLSNSKEKLETLLV